MQATSEVLRAGASLRAVCTLARTWTPSGERATLRVVVFVCCFPLYLGGSVTAERSVVALKVFVAPARWTLGAHLFALCGWASAPNGGRWPGGAHTERPAVACGGLFGERAVSSSAPLGDLEAVSFSRPWLSYLVTRIAPYLWDRQRQNVLHASKPEAGSRATEAQKDKMPPS